MKQISLWILCLFFCVVLLTACGQVPSVPDASMPQDVSSSSIMTQSTTTTTSAETSTTTTTATASTTTTTKTTAATTTSTTEEAATTTVTTSTAKEAAGTEDTPPASLSFNWKGEEVLLTYKRDITAYDPRIEERTTGWTFVSETENNIEINWQYCGTTKAGEEIRCKVLPVSHEIICIAQFGYKAGAGADDENAIRNKVFEELHKMGYTYAKEEISIETSMMGKCLDDGYFAEGTAHNETDGGLFMRIYWIDGRGWEITSMTLDVNNRYRIPNWQ